MSALGFIEIPFFGIIGLREMGLTSVRDFWHVASTVI